MTKKYLNRAAEYLGVEPGAVMSYKLYEDEIAVIVDNGPAGCPKYIILLAALDEPEPAELVITDPEVVEHEPEADVDLGVYEMSYRDLQAKAKELDIPANQSKEELIAAIWPELDGDYDVI